MKEIKFCSFNVKGINDVKKRRDIFAWLRKKAFDICFLQETHSTNSNKHTWENEWGYKCFISSYSGNSRGTAILFNNTFQFIIHKEIYDSEGRFIILDVTINDVRLTLVNLYGPNLDESVFFTMVKTKLGEFNNSKIIIGGDFNVVQDYALDTFNIQNKNNPKCHEVINSIKDDFDLQDPWRLQNPTTRIYTWHNSRKQQSRLDYFLVSEEMLNIINSTQITPGYRSDHSIVQLIIKLSEQKKGPGLWKFNNSLLNDHNYVKEIKTCIFDTTRQYSDQNQIPTIGNQLFFEMLKLQIRGKTIGFSSAKKKNQNKEEKILDEKIDSLHKLYTLNPTDENFENLKTAQNDLESLREKKIDGIITRAKARWHLEGERNSKYFCNLENRHYTEKTITKLKNENNEEITDPKDILNVQKQFYETLYTSNNAHIDRQ